MVTTLDLSEWGDNLTVDLQASPPYYETTGDQSSREELVSTASTTYAIRTVYGDASHDNAIIGSAQGDSLYGGAGANAINGMCGNDFMTVGHYESESNSYHLGAISLDDIVSGGNGTDTLAFDGASGSTPLDNVTSIEYIQLGSSAVNIQTTPDALVDAGATLTLDGSLSSQVTFWANNDTNSHFYLIGGSGDDYLKGSGLADTLFGGAGNDCLSGLGGDDTIFGTGGGNDTLLGGDGNDRFSLGTDLTGSDEINGGDGADSLYFTDNGTGSDELTNVTGIEHIILGNANTHIVYSPSETGTITINGSAITAANTLNYNGADATQYQHIIGGAGSDSITGGSGNDTLEGGAGADTLNGGSGVNMLSYASSTAGVNVNLSTNMASGGHADGDVLTSGSFHGVIGGSGNDTLIGTRHNERFEGGAGNDRIDGSGGADTGAGIGVDTIMGGAGNDTIVISTPVGAGSIYNGEAGTDTLELQTTAIFTAASVSGIEVIYFASAGKTATFGVAQMGAWTLSTFDPGSASTLGITGTAGNDVIDLTTLTLGTNWGLSGNVIAIQAGLGDDLIRASASAEYIAGGEGFDTLDYSGSTAGVSVNLQTASVAGGYANNDSISGIAAVIGSDFADTLAGSDDSTNALYGGGGNDSFIMSTYLEAEDTVSGGDGTDTLTFTYNGGDVLTNVTGIEHITLGDAATTLVGHDTLADYLSTFTLDATALSGGNNLDWDGTFIANFRQHVIGSAASDTIVGGSSHDTLLGGAGKDWLEGGAGCDSLDGGGNDELQRELDIASYENEEYAINANLFTGRVTGGGYTDTISGIEGIRGTTLGDTFVGDSGWVNLFFDGGGSDSYDGNSEHDPDEDTGFDIVSYHYATAGITAIMIGTSGSVTLGGNVDTLTDIDMIWATPYDDLLTGGEGDEEFMPGEGDDVVDGGGSEDWDSVTYWALDSGVNVTWVTDHWQVTDPDVNWTDTLTNIEAIEGSAGDDSFTGSNNNDHFSGWAGADAFDGGNGMDTVSYEE
ncbi:MAG: hypothetical protein KKD85_13780, partial [Proteobacteria bacterium]|nr:hypothetical protein [Pseudomonadota bacterium]